MLQLGIGRIGPDLIKGTVVYCLFMSVYNIERLNGRSGHFYRAALPDHAISNRWQQAAPLTEPVAMVSITDGNMLTNQQDQLPWYR